MVILSSDTRTSFIKAIIPEYLEKGFYSNHKLQINRFSVSQTLPASHIQIVRIQYDLPLVATITKNSDI